MSFSPQIFLTIFLVKSKLSTAKKSKTTTFSRDFHPEKSTIFSENQSWIFVKKMKISNSVRKCNKIPLSWNIFWLVNEMITGYSLDASKKSLHIFLALGFVLVKIGSRASISNTTIRKTLVCLVTLDSIWNLKITKKNFFFLNSAPLTGIVALMGHRVRVVIVFFFVSYASIHFKFFSLLLWNVLFDGII